MELIFKHRAKKPQGYYYKHNGHWVKFRLEFQDGLKWNLFCHSLGREVTKLDFERFLKETGVEVVG